MSRWDIKGLMICLILAILFFFPLSLHASDGITAASYLLVEKDSFTIISGKDFHRRLAPASTTKVITATVAIEKLGGHEGIVPDKKVLSIPHSKMNLIPGKRYAALDLIKGAMIESANDAAYTLGTYIGGSEEGFARMMNDKARDIGASNTNFKNASGLFVDGQYTTCYDLALIFRYALSNERFREIASTKYFSFQDQNRSTTYKNHNRFLFCFEPAIGGKTGFTRASKHCYVGAFEKEGKVYILSLLGSRNLWGDAVLILKGVYDRLPSDREIQLAKAGAITLSAYKVKKEKKQLAKKKMKKHKKSKKKYV
jgi:serine-type D-Ala-D-Ala carboxypeptidase (penicillin-binding protein 5/6)